MKKSAINKDLNTPQEAARFRKAAVAYTKEATRDRETARATLVKLGVYTKSGRLSKNYSH